jgi:cytochrome P450
VVTAASTGSHGLGLSIAARIRGIQAHIFVPDNTVRAKTQAKVDDDYEQESHQVYYDEERASWLVFHYEDVQQVLLDPQTFSSQRTFNPDGSIDPLVNGGLIGMDPPHHRHMRTFIAQAFTPRVVAQFEPQIRAIVQELLDQVQHKGTMDFVDDLAFPLPVLFIAELLGVPGGDREQFRCWTTDFVGPDYELRASFPATRPAGKHQGTGLRYRMRNRRYRFIHAAAGSKPGWEAAVRPMSITIDRKRKIR